MHNALATAYDNRRPILEHVAHALETEVKEYLSCQAGIGRISFSASSTKHFLDTVETLQASGQITDPLVEVEDQISGTVTVASDRELIAVETRLKGVLSSVERSWQEDTRSMTGGLPIRTLICVIPPQVKPPGWDARDDVPKTFEIRLTIDSRICPANAEAVDTLPIHGGAKLVASEPPLVAARVLFGLHGIRTHADWYRPLNEIAPQQGWQVRTDRWYFGRFGLVRFLLPGARSAKVRWFRKVYREEVRDRDVHLTDQQRPSIVAHSFGTYILGNALLKYDWLRFNKVILCGSILPRDFPWDELIKRGQVQAVRNEVGTNDVPTTLVRWFVAGTGPSGRAGFTRSHRRFEQEQFEYTHSEYFDKGHMEAKWLPFLDHPLPFIAVSAKHVKRPKANRPWGLYAVYTFLFAAVFLVTKSFGVFNTVRQPPRLAEGQPTVNDKGDRSPRGKGVALRSGGSNVDWDLRLRETLAQTDEKFDETDTPPGWIESPERSSMIVTSAQFVAETERLLNLSGKQLTDSGLLEKHDGKHLEGEGIITTIHDDEPLIDVRPIEIEEWDPRVRYTCHFSWKTFGGLRFHVGDRVRLSGIIDFCWPGRVLLFRCQLEAVPVKTLKSDSR